MNATEDPPPPNPDDGKPGRPTKLTPERTALIVAGLLAGNFRNVAGAAAGVRPRTFSLWMTLGKKYPDGMYGAFRRAVLAAEAEAEARAVRLIASAAQMDAKHAEWWLERKHPQRWGRSRGEFVEIKKQIQSLKKMIGENPDPAYKPVPDGDS